MSKDQFCPKCDHPEISHREEDCLRTQLAIANKEIIKLKSSIDEWKNSWFELRNIVGNLWWDHPAISSDQERDYYLKLMLDWKYPLQSCQDNSCGHCLSCENLFNDIIDQHSNYNESRK